MKKLLVIISVVLVLIIASRFSMKNHEANTQRNIASKIMAYIEPYKKEVEKLLPSKMGITEEVTDSQPKNIKNPNSVNYAPEEKVFRCTVEGKTVYQGKPCLEQGGREIVISHGPTREQVAEAQAHAEATKKNVAELEQERRRKVSENMAKTSSQESHGSNLGENANCASLDKEREDAYGMRNKALYRTRISGKDFSPDVDGAMAVIRRVEESMKSAGCPFK